MLRWKRQGYATVHGHPEGPLACCVSVVTPLLTFEKERTKSSRVLKFESVRLRDSEMRLLIFAYLAVLAGATRTSPALSLHTESKVRVPACRARGCSDGAGKREAGERCREAT
jgi:hypothetical protein